MKKGLPLILILILAGALRLWGLDQYPAGLNADEAALGYNAYSLINTGHDEHGSAWPLAFRSFDDYKPGVYVYLTMPFIYLLGLTEWSVRLPSAFLGILSVYLVYFLANQLLAKKSKKMGLLAGLLLAISPWHIHFSRGGWETNAATTFLLLFVLFFLKAIKTPKLYLVSVFFGVLSLYTYHSMRVVLPLLGMYLLVWQFKNIKSQVLNKKTTSLVVGSIIMGILFLLPLGIQTIKGSTSARFSGVSIFAQSGPFWAANEQRGQHKDPQSLVSRVIHNQYYNYAQQYFFNISSHYSDPFLFFTCY